jgi:hypothetical protein
MKRCPQCNRVEADDTLAFCRADGVALVSDSLPISSEAGTATFGSAATEIETSILPHATAANVSRSIRYFLEISDGLTKPPQRSSEVMKRMGLPE